MNVGIFYPTNNTEHYSVLLAFSLGVDKTGDDTLELKPLRAYKTAENDYDVCVVFGVRKTSVPTSEDRGRLIFSEIAAGKDVIILEKGFIRRETYFSAGLNSFNGLAVYNTYGSSPDRFKALCEPLRPWEIKKHGYILLVGQVPWDASVQHTNHIEWLYHTVKVIREFTDRPILFRPHPLAGSAVLDIRGTETSTNDLITDLAGAFAVVTFNSNVGVDSVLDGVPTFCVDPLSMIYPQAAVGLEQIENPPTWNRRDWANRLAYTQWSKKEMTEGLPWLRLKELVLKRKEDAIAC